MKNILVIGGSGFMGSHTADELSNRGYAVTILDIETSIWLRKDQKMVVADLGDLNAVQAAMHNIDVVYHFAGIADIGEAKLRPYETIESNVMGVATIMDAAVKAGVKRLVYASTMYVYSDFGSFYRASKQASEILIEAYAEEFGIEFTLLRYGSLYGPRAQNWNGIHKFITQIMRDGIFEYSGDGSEMREYIHVLDAARLSVDVLDSSHVNAAITITGQQLIRVDQLASMLFEISGKVPNVIFHGKHALQDHYGQTPYRYNPKSAKKLVPTEFVDLGQGLLDIFQEIGESNELDSYKFVFLDFDGVIKDSCEIKADAFEQLFSPYGEDIAKRVRIHHEANGGMSRYEKLPLYLEWVGIRPDQNTIEEFSRRFSSLAKNGVINSPWVVGMPDYLINNQRKKPFFLVTATPQEEIEEILDALNIHHCFKQVIGSPTNKTTAVSKIMRSFKIKPEDAVMVGDSTGDHQAAVENDIMFVLRETSLNQNLQKIHSGPVIKDFSNG
jgi:UDP-glucose 4-epimerase